MSDTSNGFGIEYAGTLIYCETFMKDHEHDIHFNGEYVASVTMNENFEWRQTAGAVLPKGIIDELGRRIEHKYE